MTDISKEHIEVLANALMAQQQADMDGTMVMVSRQACDESADTLRAQVDEIERLKAKITWMEQIDREAIVANLQAQLATARREGGEEMREEAAQAVWDNQPRHYTCGVANYLFKTIRALPLPGDES